MKLLRVIHSMDPAGGGPAAGIRAVSPALAALGVHAEVVSTDAPDAPFLRQQIHGLDMQGFGPSTRSNGFCERLRPWISENISRFDAVIIHGLWQYPGYAAWCEARSAKIPHFIYPHGMLDPWFKQAYPLKHFKKQLYWLAIEHRIFRTATSVFFTCAEEQRLARRTFWPYECRETPVNYGTADAPPAGAGQTAAFLSRCPEAANRRVLLFLGRIHEKKGVAELLRAFGKIRAEFSSLKNADCSLVIGGPCADENYLGELRRIAAVHCPQDSVLWPGMLEGAAKWGAFRAADAFILPSHQENFGIAVAEALACGTPVLLSDKVNIWSEITHDGAGLVAPDTEVGAAKLIREWLGLNDEQRTKMRTAARKCFVDRFEIHRVAESLHNALKKNLRS